MAQPKEITVAPLTGVFDLRSSPDLMPRDSVRMRLNLQTVAEGKLRRGVGWSKLLSKSGYNNSDFHDQLLVFDGVPMNLFYTLDGSEPTENSTPYTGPIELLDGQVFKVIAINGPTVSETAEAVAPTSSDDTLTWVNNKISIVPADTHDIVDFQDLQSVSFGSLTEISGSVVGQAPWLQFNENENLESVTLSALVLIRGARLQINDNDILETVNLPVLAALEDNSTTGADLDITGNTLMETALLPALATMDIFCNLNISSNPALTTLDLSGLTLIADVNLSFNTALTTPDIGAFTIRDGGTLNMSESAYDEATINFVLARCVASAAFVSGDVNLAGGTNAAPTGQGITDVATLTGRGVTVTTN